MMKRKDIIALCAKEITGSINEAEKEILNAWLTESSEHMHEYEKYKELWEKVQTSNMEEPDANIEWRLLSERLKLDLAEKSQEQRRLAPSVWWKSIFSKGVKPAFAIALLLIVSSVAVWITRESPVSYKITEMETGNGTHKRIVLPDSSVVVLNSGSSVKYSNPMGEAYREVELKGEGFFSVKKGDKPFIVKTDNASVTVLGTKFNVWARGSKTKVIVQEGRVNLSDQKDETKSVTLTESESSIILPGNAPTEPAKVNTEQLLGWMDGKLVFYKSSLGEITGELERYYDKKFVLADKDLKDLSMTGTFEDEDPDTLLSMICLALGVQYNKISENEYVIMKKQQS